MYCNYSICDVTLPPATLIALVVLIVATLLHLEDYGMSSMGMIELSPFLRIVGIKFGCYLDPRNEQTHITKRKFLSPESTYHP